MLDDGHENNENISEGTSMILQSELRLLWDQMFVPKSDDIPMVAFGYKSVTFLKVI